MKTEDYRSSVDGENGDFRIRLTSNREHASLSAPKRTDSFAVAIEARALGQRNRPSVAW